MKLLDRFTEVGPTNASSLAVVTDGWPLYRDGWVSSLVAVELVAQTAAAVTAWRENDTGEEDHFGLMVGVKNARFFDHRFQVEDRLTTHVTMPHLLHNVDAIYGVCEGSVFNGSQASAEVAIQILRPLVKDFEL